MRVCVARGLRQRVDGFLRQLGAAENVGRFGDEDREQLVRVEEDELAPAGAVVAVEAGLAGLALEGARSFELTSRQREADENRTVLRERLCQPDVVPPRREQL